MSEIVLAGEEHEQALTLYQEMEEARKELNEQRQALDLASKRYDYLRARFWSYVGERHEQTKDSPYGVDLRDGQLVIRKLHMPSSLHGLMFRLGGEGEQI